MNQLDPALTQLGIQILQAVLPTLGTMIGSLTAWALYKAIGLIKNKQLQSDVASAVAFAENQLVGSQTKLDYVSNFIKSKVGNSLSDQEIAHLVESAVLAMQNATPPVNLSSPPAALNNP